MVDWILTDEKTGYKVIENESITVVFHGIILRKTEQGFAEDVAEIASLAANGELDHNELFGAYRIAVRDNRNGRVIFWSDSCGSMAFYYDTVCGVISDSFLRLVRMKTKPEPDTDAIARIFSRSQEFCRHTPVKDILFTSSDMYYILENGRISEHSKNMRSIGDSSNAVELHELLSEMLSAIGDRKFASVCTGGTDSRAILANLISLGAKPELAITGAEGNPDIRIARKIADRVGLPLNITDTENKEPDWLEKAFEYSDGVGDPVLCYRHMRKVELMHSKGVQFEFNGVGGEFYKNDFYKKGKGIPNRAALVEMVCPTIIPNWTGEALRKPMERINDGLLSAMEPVEKSSRLSAFNEAGRRAMTSNLGTISGPLSHYYTSVLPIMEPRVIASVSSRDPETLWMHRWQREQIARYAPELAEFETNLGYSCILDDDLIREESRRERKRRAVISAKKIVKKLSPRLAQKAGTMKMWEGDFVEARNSQYYKKAFDVCRKMKLIGDDITAEQIPVPLTGIILRIGMIFSCE